MATATRCPSGDCPTIGVEATALGDYEAVQTEAGDWLIYEFDEEEAWIQSDVYFPRSACV